MFQPAECGLTLFDFVDRAANAINASPHLAAIIADVCMQRYVHGAAMRPEYLSEDTREWLPYAINLFNGKESKRVARYTEQVGIPSVLVGPPGHHPAMPPLLDVYNQTSSGRGIQLKLDGRRIPLLACTYHLAGIAENSAIKWPVCAKKPHRTWFATREMWQDEAVTKMLIPHLICNVSRDILEKNNVDHPQFA